ncbi:MAG: FecR domain-containing protein [Deltaproteobacteria bacterium]|nr:FecR domain-containing protein [Deltaproteobacteria bacterium]
MSTIGLGKKIAVYQDEMLAARDLKQNDIEAVRARLFDREVTVAAPRRNYLPIWAFGFAAAAACGLALFLLLPLGQDGSLRDTDNAAAVRGEWLSAIEAPRSVVFSDHSRVRLRKGAAARILKEEGHNVHFLLEKGTAEVEVVHHNDTHWILDCGPYTVSVIGTRFLLSWDPSGRIFDLKMIDGTVELVGPMVEKGRRVSGRESFRADMAAGTYTVQSNASRQGMDAEMRQDVLASESNDVPDAVSGKAAPSVAVEDTPSSDGGNDNDAGAEVPRKRKDSGRYAPHGTGVKGAPQNIATESDSASWRELNRAGRFDEVVQEARAQGIASVLTGKPVSELMALADAARLKQEWQLSRETYIAVRQRAPKSNNAQTAAFSIGRIAFDVQRDYAAASQWLQTYLHEAPSGRLAREALGRLMEAQQKTGNLIAARQSAAKYLLQFPDGPHAEVARRLQSQ